MIGNIIIITDTTASGNTLLADPYYVLNIQLSASLGTLVTNNSVLCFTADLAWNRRKDSLLEYSISQACSYSNWIKLCLMLVFQCPGIACNLFVQGPLCVSRCAGCGMLCEPFPITDMNSLGLYLSRGCTTVVGDLYIMNLPSAITKTILTNNLATVRYITGTLYIINCQWLGSLLPVSYTHLTLPTIYSV